MRVHVCMRACLGARVHSPSVGKKGVGEAGQHSKPSLVLGTAQMAAASPGGHLPAALCLLIYFDLTRQGRWLGGRRLVRVNIWWHVNNECTCGINQPYHFWLGAMAMESHVSCGNQSKGIAAYPSLCFSQFDASQRVPVFSVKAMVSGTEDSERLVCARTRWSGFSVSQGSCALVGQWFKDQQTGLGNNRITNTLFWRVSAFKKTTLPIHVYKRTF